MLKAPTVRTFDRRRIKELIKKSDPELRVYIECLHRTLERNLRDFQTRANKERCKNV